MDINNKLNEIEIILHIVNKVQRGEVFTALEEIDKILADPTSSQCLINRAISQQTAAIAVYNNLAFLSANPDLFGKEVE